MAVSLPTESPSLLGCPRVRFFGPIPPADGAKERSPSPTVDKARPPMKATTTDPERSEHSSYAPGGIDVHIDSSFDPSERPRCAATRLEPTGVGWEGASGRRSSERSRLCKATDCAASSCPPSTSQSPQMASSLCLRQLTWCAVSFGSGSGVKLTAPKPWFRESSRRSSGQSLGVVAQSQDSARCSLRRPSLVIELFLACLASAPTAEIQCVDSSCK